MIWKPQNYLKNQWRTWSRRTKYYFSQNQHNKSRLGNRAKTLRTSSSWRDVIMKNYHNFAPRWTKFEVVMTKSPLRSLNTLWVERYKSRRVGKPKPRFSRKFLKKKMLKEKPRFKRPDGKSLKSPRKKQSKIMAFSNFSHSLSGKQKKRLREEAGRQSLRVTSNFKNKANPQNFEILALFAPI